MTALLRRLFRLQRRRGPRELRDQLAYGFAGVTPLGSLNVLDVSETGARVRLLARLPPEEVSRIVVLESSQLFKVEFVWAREDEAGYRVLSTRRLQGYTEGEDDQLKAWWLNHRSRSPT